jgi:MFS family permease
VALGAGAAQLGLLNAMQYLPVAAMTLFAGVIADRRSRRATLIWANVGLGLTLAAVPALAIAGSLSMVALYVVAFAAGTLSALFDVTYIAFVPTIVRREQLVEANGKLQGSKSVAQLAGQGAGGMLIQLLSAPLAVLVDVSTFVVAAASLLVVSRQAPGPRPARRPARADIVEGLRVTFRHRTLRTLMIQSAVYNMLLDVVLVVVPVYVLRSLHLSPGTLGLIVASGGLGALAGAAAASRVGDRFGVGAAIVIGMVLSCVALLLVPLAGGSRAELLAGLIGAYCLYGAGEALFNVHSVALRQAIVPDQLLGRVAATYRFVTWSVIPVGGLAGGIMATGMGARGALLCSSLLMLGSCAWFARSGMVRLRAPEPVEEESSALAAPA